MPRFSRAQIIRLLESLNAELKQAGVRGDVYLAGGAVMCLAFEARDSTKDVDVLFRPSNEIREAVLRVASKEGVPDNWLNDAVRAYVSDRPSYTTFREMSNLRVFCADARYMLAMKCLAMRMAEGFRDEDDVRYLLRHLGIEEYEDALDVIGKYYSPSEFPATALAVLRELTNSSGQHPTPPNGVRQGRSRR